MAVQAVARETICALRQDIAKIEGRLEKLEPSPGADITVLRRGAAAFRNDDLLPTGAADLDAALGGGLSRGALSEIHAAQTRDAGASAGFTLALAALAMKEQARKRMLLWIGTAGIFREAGLPYAGGVAQAFGFQPDELVFADAPRLADALWIAEEAARQTALSAVVLELRGNPEKLDLTATRRLHRRAADAGQPVFLLRQAAVCEPTAAPVRLVVAPAPAARRETLAGPLDGSLGNPAFSVSIGKSRTARPGRFLLEWNPHDIAFQQRQEAHSRHLVSLSRHGADLAPASRTVVALQARPGRAAADHQPAREQHTAYLRA